MKKSDFRVRERNGKFSLEVRHEYTELVKVRYFRSSKYKTVKGWRQYNRIPNKFGGLGPVLQPFKTYKTIEKATEAIENICTLDKIHYPFKETAE